MRTFGFSGRTGENEVNFSAIGLPPLVTNILDVGTSLNIVDNIVGNYFYRAERKYILYKAILQATDHRPFPLPKLPWVMTQKWGHVLFMHWPVPEEVLREHVPSLLEIDTFDGDAWIGILPFEVSDVRVRGLPRIPFYHSLLEVNVRTYVKHKGVSGVYFFSLDANKLAIVLGARMLTLPYTKAKMRMKKDSRIKYYSKRAGLNKNQAIFHGRYQPLATTFIPAEPGTLTHWLVERYRLWTIRGKALYQGDIHHKQWKLGPASTEMQTQTLTSFLPDKYFNEAPLLHYSPAQRALIWPLKKIKVQKPYVF